MRISYRMLLAAAFLTTSLSTQSATFNELSTQARIIDQSLNQINASGMLKKGTLDDIEDRIDKYYKDLETATLEQRDRLLKIADGSVNGNIGNSLVSFERNLASQQVLTKNIQRKVDAINVKISNGRIGIEKAIINDLTDDELTELKSVLKPSVLQRYRVFDPRLTQTTVLHAPTRLAQDSIDRLLRLDERQLHDPFHDESLSATPSIMATMGNSLSDILLPKANASIAAGCVAVCTASAGSGCAPCLMATLGPVAELTVAFDAAYSSCKKLRWKWLKKACKTGVIAAYIGAIG